LVSNGYAGTAGRKPDQIGSLERLAAFQLFAAFKKQFLPLLEIEDAHSPSRNEVLQVIDHVFRFEPGLGDQFWRLQFHVNCHIPARGVAIEAYRYLDDRGVAIVLDSVGGFLSHIRGQPLSDGAPVKILALTLKFVGKPQDPTPNPAAGRLTQF
jgi:hypothetical protein